MHKWVSMKIEPEPRYRMGFSDFDNNIVRGNLEKKKENKRVGQDGKKPQVESRICYSGPSEAKNGVTSGQLRVTGEVKNNNICINIHGDPNTTLKIWKTIRERI